MTSITRPRLAIMAMLISASVISSSPANSWRRSVQGWRQTGVTLWARHRAALQVAVKSPAAPNRLLADLKSSDVSTRHRAADQLGALRAKAAVRSLISALSDKEARVREAAAFALGQITEPRAADALIKLLGDKVSEVRASAAFALGMLGDKKASKALSAALDDEDSAVRSSAAVGLALMEDEEASDEIIAMLNDPSFEVRYDAAWALGHLGEPEAASHLRAALVNLDLIGADEQSREAFRQVVQTSLEGLRLGVDGVVGPKSVGRPRRISGTVNPTPGGEQIQLRLTRPSVLRQSVRPAATQRAQRAGVTGSVGLRVLVGADGRPVRAYVVRRLGFGLDQRAVQAALRYRFDPAMLDGLPQTEWLNIDVKF